MVASKMTTYWIQPRVPGRIGTASRPRGGEWLEDEIRAWKADRVDVAVSLLTPEEVREFDLETEETTCRKHGIDFRTLPIPDRGVPSSPAAALELAAGLARAVNDGKSVIIHCRQGIGRSVIITASVLVLLGWEPGCALAAIGEARGRPVPDTPEQRKWVEGPMAQFATEWRPVLRHQPT